MKKLALFNRFRHVANGYTKGQVFKSHILSSAQKILIFLSAAVMSLSVLFYEVTTWTFTAMTVLQAAAYILICFMLALVVEALIFLTTHTIKTEKNTRKEQPERNKESLFLPWTTLLFCTAASISAGELFFGKLAEGKDLFTTFVLRLFGALIPIMQIMYELHQESIKDFIIKTVDTSDVSNHILETQTRSNLVEARFTARADAMKQDDVQANIVEHSKTFVVAFINNATVAEEQSKQFHVITEHCFPNIVDAHSPIDSDTDVPPSEEQSAHNETQALAFTSSLDDRHDYGNAIWHDVNILDGREKGISGNSFELHGVQFGTFAAAERFFEDATLTKEALILLFRHRSVNPKFFRYVKKQRVLQKVVALDPTVKLALLDAITKFHHH